MFSLSFINKKPRILLRGLCDPDWIQTNDPQLRRLLLYSAELPDHHLRAAKVIFN
jgi:hypothetical protein